VGTSAEEEAGRVRKRRSGRRTAPGGSQTKKGIAQIIGQSKECEGGPPGMNWIAGLRRSITLGVVFSVVLQTTSAGAQSASASGTSGTPHTSTSPQTAALERDFFAAIREGDAKKFLSYVPEAGVHVGPHAKLVTRIEVEQQFSHHRDLYCTLFDSSCIDASIKLDASSRACSDRELLTHSGKIRTAATETVRNSVRQAILVAEVKNDQCGGTRLIDFIFNYVQGEWKLFSIP
jgi:hypothetical protein